MLVSWQAGMLPGMHRVIVMATDEIEAAHRELVSKGIDFELPPTPTPGGRRLCSATPSATP